MGREYLMLRSAARRAILSLRGTIFVLFMTEAAASASSSVLPPDLLIDLTEHDGRSRSLPDRERSENAIQPEESTRNIAGHGLPDVLRIHAFKTPYVSRGFSSMK